MESVSRSGVAIAVAEFLGVEAHTIDPHTPLTAYGIDSLGAMQLIATLEDRFQCALPESLLTECADLHRLTGALTRATAPHTRDETTAHALRDRLIADSHLAEDIRPAIATRPALAAGARNERRAAAAAQRVMLTGATGFLGTSLLRALIDAGLYVVCPVRATSVGPAARVRASLDKYGLWRETDRLRFMAVAADLEQARFGLSQELYDQLAEETDAVYHAAADVNWVAGYDSLRSVNVSATASLLRFACARRQKRFHFVSSLSVCMAADGPPLVTERTDMLPYVERLALGYAQSKCVSESLVRTAAERGLPAQIYRPALLAGHSTSGASNTDDLIAALLKGCIQLGAAPDLDWAFDAVPVDTAANAIVAISRSCGATLETFHLRHPRPRHWRECVLWANFFGYPIRLEAYDRWLERLRRDAHSPDHALYRLRGFFTRQTYGRTTPEHYEESAHSRIECRRTRGHERLAGINYPPLDADLLDSYLTDFVRRGFLPPPPASRRVVARAAAETSWPIRCETLLREYFADDRLRVLNVDLVQRGSEHSIISEMTSWKRGRQAGLFHYRLSLERGAGVACPPESKGRSRACPPESEGRSRACPPESEGRRRESLSVMAKVKPPDEDSIEIAETTAAIVDTDLHRQITRFRDQLGVRGAHLRELEIYRLHAADPVGRYLPRCYGMWADDDRQEWGLLLEHLDDMALMDAQSAEAWTDRFRAAAIDGLADIHAKWLGRERELLQQPWVGHVPSEATIIEMTPLWLALARHAAPMFLTWADAGLVETHAGLAGTADQWAPGLEALPRTLIHNDFNPRNVALRNGPAGPRLVAYDWELATVGAPQRDLAEFLCFTLPESVDQSVLHDAIERHRAMLERQSGVSLGRHEWQAGFRSALAHVLVSRLAFYAMIHRVRPLSFLPRAVRTWARLYALTLAGKGRQQDLWGGSRRVSQPREADPPFMNSGRKRA